MLECLNPALVLLVYDIQRVETANFGLKSCFQLPTLTLVCKPQTISSQVSNHFVKNANHAAEQNLPHGKHEKMCVEFENGTKNGAEATFAEIRDGEQILKKQSFPRFKSDHKSMNSGDIKLISSQFLDRLNKESNKHHGSRIQECVQQREE